MPHYPFLLSLYLCQGSSGRGVGEVGRLGLGCSFGFVGVNVRTRTIRDSIRFVGGGFMFTDGLSLDEVDSDVCLSKSCARNYPASRKESYAFLTESRSEGSEPI